MGPITRDYVTSWPFASSQVEVVVGAELWSAPLTPPLTPLQDNARHGQCIRGIGGRR